MREEEEKREWLEERKRRMLMRPQQAYGRAGQAASKREGKGVHVEVADSEER